MIKCIFSFTGSVSNGSLLVYRESLREVDLHNLYEPLIIDRYSGSKKERTKRSKSIGNFMTNCC